MTTRKNTTTDTTPDSKTTDTTPADVEGQAHDAEEVDDTAVKPAEPVETVDERRARLLRELDELDPPKPIADKPADPEETREQRRARLRRELDDVDEEARLHGGYKEIPTHIAVLLDGTQVAVTNANATEHYSEDLGRNVPIVSFYAIPEDLRNKTTVG